MLSIGDMPSIPMSSGGTILISHCRRRWRGVWWWLSQVHCRIRRSRVFACDVSVSSLSDFVSSCVGVGGTSVAAHCHPFSSSSIIGGRDSLSCLSPAYMFTTTHIVCAGTLTKGVGAQPTIDDNARRVTVWH